MAAPSTPPRATSRYTRARTPPSPTHGPVLQNYEPYSPRRSSRNVGNPYGTLNLGSRPASNRIPPLQTPKRPTFAFTPAQLFPTSPPKSPLNTDTNNHNTSLLKTPHDNKSGLGPLDPSSSGRKPTRMLLTPSKTPTVTPSRKHNRTASVENTARILHFQPDDPNDVMPLRRNKYKQRSIRAATMHGLDLDEENTSEPSRLGNSSFEVYAESHARIPQLDESEENPFYRPRATTVPLMLSSPRRTRKTVEQLAEDRGMDDAASRDEGMVYMFRGKKVFRTFGDVTSDSEMDSTANQRSLKRSAGVTAQRPLTRSSIQPRLLFPSSRIDDIDEEAETDVDMSDVPVDDPKRDTSDMTSFSLPATPAKTKSGTAPMISPPTTSRTSRKRNMGEDSVLQDDIPESTLAKAAAAALPTPQRSSKKKKVDINPIPTFQSETMPAEDDPSVALTPQRSSRKRKAASELTPIVEHSPEPSSSAGSASSASRSKNKSPFDSWPRTKKRDGEPVESYASKRTRSSVA